MLAGNEETKPTITVVQLTHYDSIMVGIQRTALSTRDGGGWAKKESAGKVGTHRAMCVGCSQRMKEERSNKRANRRGRARKCCTGARIRLQKEKERQASKASTGRETNGEEKRGDMEKKRKDTETPKTGRFRNVDFQAGALKFDSSFCPPGPTQLEGRENGGNATSTEHVARFQF